MSREQWTYHARRWPKNESMACGKGRGVRAQRSVAWSHYRLSGRTVAYRTKILQDDAFTHGFTHEEWRTCQLNADDDNFITRWMYSHDWKIAMQYHKEAEVQTTLEDSPKYLNQCLRWVRSNWRSNLTSMFVERHYWCTQPWSTYSVLQTTITAWALPYDSLMIYAWIRATASWSDNNRVALLSFLLAWIFLFSKTVKLWGHFFRYPADVVFLPIYIGFGYFHGAIKLWGLFTLSEVSDSWCSDFRRCFAQF